MQREVTVAEVRTAETRGGNVRWIVSDSDGNEYTTFREHIGAGLHDLEGKRARIEFHEQRRGQYTNVYLDAIEPADTTSTEADPEQVAWQAAVEAAPWLVGEPKSAVQPKHLYDKLKPFEEYVARDIEEHRRGSAEGD